MSPIEQASVFQVGVQVKIGILTLPLFNNYGGLVQAAALYHFLEQNGHEVVLLSKKYERPIHKRIAAQILRKIPFHNIGNVRSIEAQRAIHYGFLDRFIPNRSRQLYSSAMLRKFVRQNDIECVIVGSDQVWRPDYVSDEDTRNFFLGFSSEIRKVSYAASFGTSEWTRPNRIPEVKELLSRFHAVSLREYSGVEICKSVLGREDCTLTLDPTLIVDPAIYEKMVYGSSTSEKHVLNYVLDKNPDFQKITGRVIKAIGGQHGVRSILLDEDQRPATVPEWVNAFRSASFVVTDSFHGTVFSILFRKPFVSIVNTERGADRFVTILDQLDLSDRLVSGDDPARIQRLVNVPIDYCKAHNKLDSLRERSRQFIHAALR